MMVVVVVVELLLVAVAVMELLLVAVAVVESLLVAVDTRKSTHSVVHRHTTNYPCEYKKPAKL